MIARLLIILLAMAAPAVAAWAQDAAAGAQTRPRIGLVLSGGGARGLAHVGVLKVLEELRVPVDAVAGTSMGAIIGGLYATGMDAPTLEREVLRIPWSQVFSNRVERPQLSQRRKEEDFEISAVLELGYRDGELLTPQSAVSSRGLESLLRRFTLPVRDVERFDLLPIPFRAVATDMETGASVVLDHGDLALALRSSMSVPGVFAPIEVGGRILGDGGLVNNVPIDVARAMGVDRVVVVNVGTPVAGRETLHTVLGLTAQMINILTEQNVQRSLASMRPGDVLVAPQLGRMSSGDFNLAPDFVAAGAAAARAMQPALAALSVPEADYAAWRRRHPDATSARAQLDFVRIEGTTLTNPERLQRLLESRPGQDFDAARAERDARRLAAGGDYVRADYQLRSSSEGDGLVFELEDKPWGPNYLRLGLDLSTDFSGRSHFNLKLSHNRHWLTAAGTEWRNRLQIGEEPTLYTELYHPLNWTSSPANDWFTSGYAGVERRRLTQFQADSGDELGQFKRLSSMIGLDLGQPWGQIGELRLGLSAVRVRTRPVLINVINPGATDTVAFSERGLRARVVVDQLDFANFPLNGYRAEAEVWGGQRSGDLTGAFRRYEAQGSWVRSFGAQTLNLHARIAIADQPGGGRLGRYTLGGFHQLSGYQLGQLDGNALAFLRAGWYMRLTRTPTLTRGFFVGATLEAGNVWADREAMKGSQLRTGGSVYLGADTGIGPLYLGLTYAPRGAAGLALFIGRP